ncbi:hypothetical protein EV426DRAFT_705910 [Tirmania nivea]|nr:hypothetical protein EV426DRAFT_705910 [Tirmania nivea]
MTQGAVCHRFGLETSVNAATDINALDKYVLPMPDIDTDTTSVALPVMTPTFARFLRQYVHATSGAGEANCHTLVNNMLIECICILVNNMPQTPQALPRVTDLLAQDGYAQRIDDTSHSQTRPPIPTIKLFGDITCTFNFGDKWYAGRLDCSIGIPLSVAPVAAPCSDDPTNDSFQGPNFFCLLAIVEAKTNQSLEAARTQLLGYLGHIHSWRKAQGRTIPTVYGVVTDGMIWQFVEITAEGVVRDSERVNIAIGGLGAIDKIMRAVIALLAKALEMAMFRNSQESGAADVN